MTLNELKSLFPNNLNNASLTGYIPMQWVRENKDEIRQLVKTYGLRRYYRGSRPKDIFSATTTRKKDAIAMVLYTK